MPSGQKPRPQPSVCDVTALYAAAREHHRARQFASAQALYQQVLAVEPDHLGSLYHLAILAIETGRPRVAIELLTRVIARRAAPDAHYHLALALQSGGRLAEAEAHYREATPLKPDYAGAQMNLGNVLAEQGRRDEAAACYARVLALDPRAVIAHYNLANMLALLGQLDEAEAHFRAAIACRPGFAEAWSNLGNLMRDRGRGAEAEAAYRRALVLKADHAEAHNNLGVMVAARGAPAQAIAHYRRALAARPGLVEAHNNLGLALARSGDAAAAVQSFREALRHKPDDLDATHHLARALFAQGAAAEAVALLTRVLDRNGNAETRSLFAFCLRGLSGEELEPVRDYVLRALASCWSSVRTRWQPASCSPMRPGSPEAWPTSRNSWHDRARIDCRRFPAAPALDLGARARSRSRAGADGGAPRAARLGVRRQRIGRRARGVLRRARRAVLSQRICLCRKR